MPELAPLFELRRNAFQQESPEPRGSRALHFVYYKFECAQRSLVTAAMVVGVTDCVSSIAATVPGWNGVTTMKSSHLVTVSTFRSTADAQIAKGILDEAGIESMIRSDNAGGMYPALAGADLLVTAEDVEKATAALDRRGRRTH